MPRTTRGASKKAPPPPQPEPERKVTRRTRSSLKAHPEESSAEGDSGIAAQAAPKPPARRRTRSQKTASAANANEEVEELPAKKRQKRTKPQDAIPKRQTGRGRPRKLAAEVETEPEVDPEGDPEPENETEREAEPADVENEESAPKDAQFWNNLNQAILPEGDRSGISLGQKEHQEEGHDREEDAGETAQEEARALEDDGNQTQLESPLQAMQAKRARKGQKQRKKISFGESKAQTPREASVELGSDRTNPVGEQPAPETRQEQSSPAQVTKQNENEKEQEKEKHDDYEFNETDEEEQNDVEMSKSGPEKDLARVDEEDDEEDDALDENNTTAVGEDTLFISAPEQDDKVILTEVVSKWVHKITSLMEREGWTGEKEWRQKFTIGRGMTKAAWLNRQDRYLHPDQFRVLFRHLYSLRELCLETPRAPLFKEQFDYLRKRESDLSKFVKSIRSLVEDISTNMQVIFATPADERNEDSDWGDLAFGTLCHKIIPLTVFVLEESFKIGGVITLGSGKEVGIPDKCRFTSTTLQLPVLVMGWLQRLYTVVTVQIAVDFPQKMADAKFRLRRPHTQRKKLEIHLDHANKAIQQGMDQLDYLAEAPQREMEDRERQLATQMAREKEQQDQREADERQMELFVKSIRRMNGSTPFDTGPPSEDDYSERHEGWHYHEDDALLSMIRKIRNPNLRALVPLVPGRSEEEVVQRVAHLRTRMRVKYEGRGEVPPLWCYPPELE